MRIPRARKGSPELRAAKMMALKPFLTEKADLTRRLKAVEAKIKEVRTPSEKSALLTSLLGIQLQLKRVKAAIKTSLE